MMTGKGKFTWPDEESYASTYEGEWEKGARNG